jgi:hypothetical protein
MSSTSAIANRSANAQEAAPRRADTVALWAGIAFSLGFTALIWWAGQRLESIPLLPDSGAAWYYWRLPEPTFWTHFTAWGFYLAHQIVMWGLIWYAQSRVKKYTAGLHQVNLWALGANVFFILLHFAQTHIWYDGLAQDVSIFSSQGSVIVMLVWILLMENSRRGLFWGKRVPFSQRVISFARKYHGYVFSWAAVYTFWYHPMVNSSGHLIGFFYMFLLLLQGSLFLTRVHVNRWWTLTQEFVVLVHGTLVAVQQGNGIWPMFLFGFAGIFILTQMHGLRLPAWAKWTFLAIYAGGIVVVYNTNWPQINEVIRIPVIEYLAVAVLAGLIWLGIKVADLVTRHTTSIPDFSEGAAID